MAKKKKSKPTGKLAEKILLDLQNLDSEAMDDELSLASQMAEAEDIEQTHQSRFLLTESTLADIERTTPEGLLDINISPSQNQDESTSSEERSSHLSLVSSLTDSPAEIDNSEQTQTLKVVDDPVDMEATQPMHQIDSTPKHNLPNVHQPQPNYAHNSSGLAQVEALKHAQNRLTELEIANEKLRVENELLTTAGEIAQKRAEQLATELDRIGREHQDQLEQLRSEIEVYRENLREKETVVARQKLKMEEYELRLNRDLKKIRVRERELENRLELTKMEKQAIVRSKDDTILDLKNRHDSLRYELDQAKQKVQELEKKIDSQQSSLGRTVRSLRLALTHLEAGDSSLQVTPLKKAE